MIGGERREGRKEEKKKERKEGEGGLVGDEGWEDAGKYDEESRSY